MSHVRKMKNMELTKKVNKNVTYGYCRISTNRQNIERQVRNITAAYPGAIIVKEVFTGTKFQGRKELEKILKKVRAGDKIIFDSVSRMSRDADEGFRLYEELYNKNISLYFLKEPHINTDVYKQVANNRLEMTGETIDCILNGINEYMLLLAKEQIKLAFKQSEKEVLDLKQRTKEGIETARRKGKQIGQQKGKVLFVKKSVSAKMVILKHNKTFGGELSDEETQIQAGISRNTLYLYKRQLKEAMKQYSYDELWDLCLKQSAKIKSNNCKTRKAKGGV